jgi:hypothetical protein
MDGCMRRVGAGVCAAVFERLRREPATAKQVARELGVGEESVRTAIRKDARLGVVGKTPRQSKVCPSAKLWGPVEVVAPPDWSAVFRVVGVSISEASPDAELSLAPWRGAAAPVDAITVSPSDYPGAWPPRVGEWLRVIPARIELVDEEEPRG